MLFFVMVVAAATVVVVMVVVFFLHPFQFCFYRGTALHSLQQLRAGKSIPRSCHDGSIGILLPQKSNRRIQFFLADSVSTGKDNGTGSLHLVIIELSKVLHIHLYLACIHDSHGKSHFHLCAGDLFYCSNYIGQFTHT